MTLHFYSATTNTTEGVYRYSDFWDTLPALWELRTNGNAYVGQGDYNFDASDDLSSVVISEEAFPYPHKLTHVIAPINSPDGLEAYVSYSIDSLEYMGYNQIRLSLIEDPVIAHMQELMNTKMLIKRTSDDSYFYVNDITDVSSSRTFDRLQEEPGDGSIQPYNFTGSWVVYTIHYEGASTPNAIHVHVKDIDSAYEYANNLTALQLKYPEVTTTKPDSFAYFGRIVGVGSDYYQCVYNVGSSRIEWRIMTSMKDPSSLFILTGFDQYTTQLIPGDLQTFNIAFPVNSNLVYEDQSVMKRVIASAYIDYMELHDAGGFVSRVEPYIVSVRTVSGSMLGIDGNLGNSGNIVLVDNPQYEVFPFTAVSRNRALVMPKSMTYNKVFKLGGTVSPKESSPFYEYYLSAFGQNIQLPYRALINGIEVSSAISSTGWTVNVHNKDNINDVYWAGELSPTMLTSINKFDEFLSQNSTYNTAKWVNAVLGGGTRVVSGALSGIIAGQGTGMLVGATSGMFSIGQQIVNYGLQEKAMKNAPNVIKGDATNYIATLLIGYGIYMFRVKATSPAFEIMEIELDVKGFPVNFVEQIGNLRSTTNATIGGRCTYVSGRLLNMLHNYHITQRINERLEAGIYLRLF